jgi:hypothetical protein
VATEERALRDRLEEVQAKLRRVEAELARASSSEHGACHAEIASLEARIRAEREAALVDRRELLVRLETSERERQQLAKRLQLIRPKAPRTLQRWIGFFLTPLDDEQ